MRKILSIFIIYLFIFPLVAEATGTVQDFPAAPESSTQQVSGIQQANSSQLSSGHGYASAAGQSNVALSCGSGTKAYFADSSPSPAAGSDTAKTTSPPSSIGGISSGTPNAGAVDALGQPAVPQRNELVCDASELGPRDTQNIIDLLKNGFTARPDEGITGLQAKGATLDNKSGGNAAGTTDKGTGSGTGTGQGSGAGTVNPQGSKSPSPSAANSAKPKIEREKLASDELILQDPRDENKGTKVKIPNEKMKPSEISQFLNVKVKGPFAFGIVLEDTLRTGKCKDPASPECTLTGPNLNRRNSGSGILADTKPVIEAFKGIKDYFIDSNQSKTQFTKADEAKLRAAVTLDANSGDVSIKTAKRPEQALVANSILAATFSAKIATNCNNSSCIISTYSLFDKYFNSWMSTEMVTSSFGPSALFYAKKLFGWTGRRGFFQGVREEYQKFLDRYRSRFITNESFLGKQLAARLQNRLDKYGWKEWYMKLVSGNANGTGYHLIKTEEFQHFLGSMLEPNGFLSHIKTKEEKAEFLRLVQDMRTMVRASKSRLTESKNAWKTAESSLGPESAVTKQAYINYGKQFSTEMMFYDDILYLDAPEWMIRHPNLGLYNKGVMVVRPDGGSEVIDLYKEHRNFQRIVKKFAEDGSFRDFEKKASEGYDHVFQSRGDGLVYYTFDVDSVKEAPINLSYGNIKTAANNRKKVFVKDDYGEYLPYNDTSEELLRGRLTKPAQLFNGDWKEGGVITPEQFVSRLTNGRLAANFENMGVYNTEMLLDTLKERNWVSRRYFDQLDKLMAQDDELIKSYFSIKGGAKWTTIPYGYWWAKKGFGIEDLSQYQLPDTWHDIKIYPGGQEIYNYAFVDFFANEGSDQGDIFVQVLNKLPWKLILDELSQKFNPVKNLYDTLSGNQLRSETENLAFYLTGPEQCAGCDITITSQAMNDFRPFFFVPSQKMTSYILEDTKTDTAKEKGQTIIAYAGRTNLEGKSGTNEGTKIDLVDAINGKNGLKSCTQAVQELNFYGINIGKNLPTALTKGGRIGGTLAAFESVSYAVFLWPGIFASAAIQLSIAPQLHDCIDTEEGYYVHYFVPVKEVKDKQATTSEKSTEKVQKLVKDAKEKLFDQFNADSGSFVQEAKDKIGTELDKFVDDSKNNDIVQATLNFEGQSSGQLSTRDLFYFWCGKGCEINAAGYRTQGGETLKGVNGVEVGLDFGKGIVTVDGKEIINKPDNVRLASTNLNVPAVEIPHLVSQACLEVNNGSDKAIEISAQGDVVVLNSNLLNCIREGVMAQTGLPLESSKLNDAFGKLDSVVTSTHPNVKALDDRIIAEGVPRKIATGRNQAITVFANKSVELSSSNDGQNSIGRLESIQFANGVIVVKPDGCFLVWLRHHEGGILPK
ncbi:Uncharacterised protein [uncultured archaeon]|nr:Uncharacterised protein [uncultured archaeon]